MQSGQRLPSHFSARRDDGITLIAVYHWLVAAMFLVGDRGACAAHADSGRSGGYGGAAGRDRHVGRRSGRHDHDGVFDPLLGRWLWSLDATPVGPDRGHGAGRAHSFDDTDRYDPGRPHPVASCQTSRLPKNSSSLAIRPRTQPEPQTQSRRVSGLLLQTCASQHYPATSSCSSLFHLLRHPPALRSEPPSGSVGQTWYTQRCALRNILRMAAA